MIKFTQEEKKRILEVYKYASIDPKSYSILTDIDIIILKKLKAWAEEPRHSPEKLDKVIDFVRRT